MQKKSKWWDRKWLKWLRRFGMGEMKQDPATELLSVFERRMSIDPIDDLVDAMKEDVGTGQDLDEDLLYFSAIGIDTNVLLRLATHPSGHNVVDYLRKFHQAPLILPGQVIQEFWNNKAGYMKAVSEKLWNKFIEFEKEINQVDYDFGDYVKNIQNALDEFKNEFGKTYDKSTVDVARRVLKNLKKTAIVSYCPRPLFYDIVAHRDKTKTPPGFEDKGRDGDFFVWADFLYGLRKQQVCGKEFSRVIFVTEDKKIDWSIGDTAHPILTSEVRALLGVSFEIWNFSKLIKETSSKSG